MECAPPKNHSPNEIGRMRSCICLEKTDHYFCPLDRESRAFYCQSVVIPRPNLNTEMGDQIEYFYDTLHAPWRPRLTDQCEWPQFICLAVRTEEGSPTHWPPQPEWPYQGGWNTFCRANLNKLCRQRDIQTTSRPSSPLSLAVSCPTIGLLHSLSLPIVDSSHRFNMPVEFGIWVNLDVNLMTFGLWHPVCL